MGRRGELVPNRVYSKADTRQQKWSSMECTRASENKQINFHWLHTRFLDAKTNSNLLCNMDSVDVRAPEDQAKRTVHAASSSFVQQLNIQEKVDPGRSLWIDCGTETRQKLGHTEQHSSRSRVGARVASKARCLNRCCSEDSNVPDMQMDHFFTICRDSARMS